MATRITMPSFGMYTAEGRLVSWLKPTGARVEEGQPILEIETDKATQEVVAPASGLLHPLAAAGAQVKEEQLLGYILAQGEAPAAAEQAPAPSAEADTIAYTKAELAERVRARAPAGGRIVATPMARRVAARHGIELAKVSGSGPNGRIVAADVFAAVARTGEAAGSGAGQLPPGVKVRERVPLSAMRRVIGERLRQSLDSAVSLTLTREVDADAFVAARQHLGDKLGVSVPFDALFIKLLARALREKPQLNAMIDGDSLALLDEINVGFAVAVEGGLLVPVLRRADTASLAEVARQVRELTERARANKLVPADLEGGTTTITNLGAAGVDAFTPVLNPPQASILGIGRIQERPVVRHGAVAIAQTCVLSLTFDHRVTDGLPAAQLLDSIARQMNDTGLLHSL